MRRHIDDMFENAVANQIKLDSNEVEAETGVDLIKLIEEGHILVIGVDNLGRIIYQSAEDFYGAKVQKVFS